MWTLMSKNCQLVSYNEELSSRKKWIDGPFLQEDRRKGDDDDDTKVNG